MLIFLFSIMSTKQTTVGSLKPGRYAIFDGVPCIIKRMDKSSTGKHGHAKYRIEAVSMLDGKKTITVLPGHDPIESPIIEKKNAQVLSIQGDVANVMDMETYETFDLDIPDDLKSVVKEGDTVVYWIILENKIMKQKK